MGRSARHAPVAVLRAVLVLFLALAGLACAQITAAADTGPRPAPAAVQNAGTAHAGPDRAADDGGADSALSETGCSGRDDVDVEPPAPVRAHQDASASAPCDDRAAGPGHDGIRKAWRPGGPAPPPSAPTLEALSVLRV